MFSGELYYLVLFLLAAAESGGRRPFEFIERYERLSYDVERVRRDHERVKRHTLGVKTEDLHVNFRSHGREFHLRLRRDDSALAPNHVVSINGRPENEFDSSFLYSGKLANDPKSNVYGSIMDGVFDGHIHTSEGKAYHVERMSKYESDPSKSKFHSIIYSEEAIKHEKVRGKRADTHHSGCGLNSDLQRQMRSFQQQAVDDESLRNRRATNEAERQSELIDEQPWMKYTEAFQRKSREKRQQGATNFMQTDAKSGLYDARTCYLRMQADQKLWEHVFNHEGQHNTLRTRNEIVALFNNHIKAVNAIYEDTDFNGVKGINFLVQQTVIYDNTTCPNNDPVENGNPFCEGNVDVSNYLNLNSIKDHSEFCLAYAFTYRDFLGGTLGLAWVASPQPSTSGGICELYKVYNEGGRRVKRSLNTGIITLVNYNNRVPPKVSQLTLAHEIGHNFGSPHDYPSYCQPGLPLGNYIMFASATSGDKPNNAKFSPCSISNISAVLYEVLRQPPVQTKVETPGTKRNCFQSRLTSFCGNSLVEEDEECDCGFNTEECKLRLDTCCYPRNVASGIDGKRCRLIANTQCSPSQGVCCEQNCTFSPNKTESICREATECSHPQTCNGTSAVCPPSRAKEDTTLCQENTKTCFGGSCNRSVCEMVGMEECFLTGGTPEFQCQLACRDKTAKEAACKSSFEIKELEQYYQDKTSKKGILLRPGSPCNDYRGYCDIFQICRSVDSNGPLARLKKLLFNSESIRTALEWVQDKWWAVVLMGIGLLLIMALFIKCCAVHTPSTNPRKAPAHSIYETLRRPATLLRGQGANRRHHHRHHHRHRSRSNNNNNPTGRDQNEPTASTNNSGGAVNAAATSAPGPSGLEPPPPYSAIARDPATYGGSGGPPRGHRKHRKRHDNPSNRADLVEMRPKRV